MKTTDSLHLHRVFALVLAYARKKSRFVPALKLRVGCAEIARRRKAGDPRSFMHTGGHDMKSVCTAPQAARLSLNHLVALYLHEIAHVGSLKKYGRSDQWDADLFVEEELGIPILYSGPLLLEWVSPSAVEGVLRG